MIALFRYLIRWNDSMGTEMEGGAIESGENSWIKKVGRLVSINIKTYKGITEKLNSLF